jgi:hypothetical protein
MASAGFEPMNLSTKGQHATSRPPKQLMHYLSLIYLITQPLHISVVFIARHQEVFTVCVQQLVCLGDCQLARSGWNSFTLTRLAASYHKA